jgi:putative glycosyltransferase (TIGR04348 family)
MRIAIVTPSRPDDFLGNSVTANRWADILANLGHEVRTSTEWDGNDANLLIALHAARSSASIQRFHATYPQRPIVVALTGTDLYRDIRSKEQARESLQIATRLVALQSNAVKELDESLRAKVCVIYQSAVPPSVRPDPLEDCFEVCVLAHLRDVKDPLRPAAAARLLPSSSRIRITHAGRALDPVWAERAREENNSRYRWIGGLTHDEAMELLARSRALVVSSEIEGGANVIAEAVVCRIPVVCSEIPGNIGMLGPDYPAYYKLGDSQSLADVLFRLEMDSSYINTVRLWIVGMADRFARQRETQSWQSLLEEL